MSPTPDTSLVLIQEGILPRALACCSQQTLRHIPQDGMSAESPIKLRYFIKRAGNAFLEFFSLLCSPWYD